MACDCGCTETSIGCTCPPPVTMDGPGLAYILTTTFSGVPADIYNTGLGYTLLLYTNTSTTNQWVMIDSNVYITSTNPHTLTTEYYVGTVGSADGSGVMTYGTASIKTSATHPSAGKILTPGQSYWIHLLSTDSTARAVTLTSFIYIWDY